MSQIVVIDFKKLSEPYDDEMDQLLEKAYGFEGLGLAVISGIPNYSAAREALLPVAYEFGQLPDDIKEKYVSKDTCYSFGWSHGKEKLLGKPDISKGSYYNNPQYDVPTTDQDLIAKYPAVLSPNIWPTEDCPKMEPAFKAVGAIAVDAGLALAKVLGIYCNKRNNNIPVDMITNMIAQSRTAKSRLLYYFPVDMEKENAKKAAQQQDAKEEEEEEAPWCGYHNDNGAITVLTSAMFFDKDGQQIPNPQPQESGLFIKNRMGESIQAKFPADCVAIQMGESAQILTGGLLLATPHVVKATKVDGVSRSTMATFLQPNSDVAMVLPKDAVREQFLRGANAELLPPGVPALMARFEEREEGQAPQTYAEFAEKTFSMYY